MIEDIIPMAAAAFIMSVFAFIGFNSFNDDNICPKNQHVDAVQDLDESATATSTDLSTTATSVAAVESTSRECKSCTGTECVANATRASAPDRSNLTNPTKELLANSTKSNLANPTKELLAGSRRIDNFVEMHRLQLVIDELNKDNEVNSPVEPAADTPPVAKEPEMSDEKRRENLNKALDDISAGAGPIAEVAQILKEALRVEQEQHAVVLLAGLKEN